MAEPVYKSVPELDQYSGSLDGSETMVMVKAGKTYRRLLANLFGTGWIASLLGAFDAFKAPDAVHADDSDTVGGEDNTALHNAALLTGTANLANIPAELTGKNAATATLAAAATKLATARTIGGVAFDGTASINLPGVNTTGNQNTSGKAAAAGVADSCSGNAATATVAASCSGNAASATVAASCSGNAATASSAGNADTLDGKHQDSFLKIDGITSGGAGDNIFQTNDAPVSSSATSPWRTHSIRNFATGIVRISYDYRSTRSGQWVHCQLRINGSVVATDNTTSTTFVTISHDIALNYGDLIEFYVYRDSGEYLVQIMNARTKTGTNLGLFVLLFGTAGSSYYTPE